MPEPLVFEVRCKGCGRSLVTVERIREGDVASLVDHLSGCSASEPLGDTPMLGDIMRGLRVTPVDHQVSRKVPPDGASLTARNRRR
jgi:hypothetical protein